MIENDFTILYYIFVFVFGTLIGSFLNVVVYRTNTGLTLGGRSFCFTCGKTLKWYELIPVASYMLQRGSCRTCKAGISLQYPAVEILTGAMFVIIFIKGLDPATTYYYLVVFSVLMVISLYDYRHKIIPDSQVIIFIALAFARYTATLFPAVSHGDFHFAWYPQALLDGLAGPLLALPFVLLYYGSKLFPPYEEGRWMGFGDAKLALGIGWLLGLSAAISAVMISFWVGAICGIILLLLGGKRITMKYEIPFGPFLVVGTLLVFALGIHFQSLQDLFS